MSQLWRSLTLLTIFVPFLQAVPFLPFLNFTSSSPLLFQSLASLLEVHPQTIFPNGRPIASITVPRPNQPYHGRHDSNSVPSPEWLALDVEMAYGIMGNMPESRLMTYQTTKNVRAIYFDGMSASLIGDGVNSQMVLLYNGTADIPDHQYPKPPPSQGRREEGPDSENKPPPWLRDDAFRARALCRWIDNSGLGGHGWGYEGNIRMNASFELIWCDFESPSLETVSNLNVSASLLNQQPHASNDQQQRYRTRRPLSDARRARRFGVNEDHDSDKPGQSDPSEPYVFSAYNVLTEPWRYESTQGSISSLGFRDTSNWFWFAAATKRYAGESRIKVDPTGIISFYEPDPHDQAQARVADDVNCLGLRANGKWESRHSEINLSIYSSEHSRRRKQIHQLFTRGRHHQLDAVGEGDGIYMRNAVEQRLKTSLAEKHHGTGEDWHYIAKEIIARYVNELQTLLDYLSRVPMPYQKHQSLEEWTYHVRQLTHWFLLPFWEYPPDPPYITDELPELFGLESALAEQALERCMSQYTSTSSPSSSVYGTAITETLHGLCSATLKIALGIEYHWFKYFDRKPDPTDWDRHITHAHLALERRAKEWEGDAEELIAWLTWVEPFGGCQERCGIREMCYVPMWPGDGGRGRESRFLWEGVCVRMEEYSPEEMERG